VEGAAPAARGAESQARSREGCGRGDRCSARGSAGRDGGAGRAGVVWRAEECAAGVHDGRGREKGVVGPVARRAGARARGCGGRGQGDRRVALRDDGHDVGMR